MELKVLCIAKGVPYQEKCNVYLKVTIASYFIFIIVYKLFEDICNEILKWYE